MIPCNSTQPETENWQQSLSRSFSRVEDLLSHLGLPLELAPQSKLAGKQFPFKVTRHFADLMQRNNPDDPLLRQVLPVADELTKAAGYSLDPLEDLQSHVGNGILHKYHGRVLLITTGACAINCRYCFRRHYPYSEHSTSRSIWEDTALQLKSSPEIKEVILSGGDPLTMTNNKLQQFIQMLEDIPHIERLRIHSRLPVVLPERIDAGLLSILKQSRLKTVMVLHVNHAQEISPELHAATNLLHANGTTLLNQAVLLKGVNDAIHIQTNLSNKLFSINVLPYYLHKLDKVLGATHFSVDEETANHIYRGMQNHLPGYLVPRYVFEQPGAQSKLLLS